MGSGRSTEQVELPLHGRTFAGLVNGCGFRDTVFYGLSLRVIEHDSFSFIFILFVQRLAAIPVLHGNVIRNIAPEVILSKPDFELLEVGEVIFLRSSYWVDKFYTCYSDFE